MTSANLEPSNESELDYVTHWDGAVQRIDVGEFPFSIGVDPEGDELVLMVKSTGFGPPVSIQIVRPTIFDITDDGLSAWQPDPDGGRLWIGDDIAEFKNVIINIAPPALITCSHGINPREACPRWPHS